MKFLACYFRRSSMESAQHLELVQIMFDASLQRRDALHGGPFELSLDPGMIPVSCYHKQNNGQNDACAGNESWRNISIDAQSSDTVFTFIDFLSHGKESRPLDPADGLTVGHLSSLQWLPSSPVGVCLSVR